ncbi:MAG: hypothetical protein M1821_004991 [Bathelium mastoideum]|nr:MAG: hypothetical protein M1821_004991 [Bathelium mastoideum]
MEPPPPGSAAVDPENKAPASVLDSELKKIKGKASKFAPTTSSVPSDREKLNDEPPQLPMLVQEKSNTSRGYDTSDLSSSSNLHVDGNTAHSNRDTFLLNDSRASSDREIQSNDTEARGSRVIGLAV